MLRPFHLLNVSIVEGGHVRPPPTATVKRDNAVSFLIEEKSHGRSYTANKDATAKGIITTLAVGNMIVLLLNYQVAVSLRLCDKYFLFFLHYEQRL
jgi:hypothetical protein